jgi:rubrerythrin
MNEDILTQAIHSEIHARDLYRKLSDRLEYETAKSRMLKLSEEEDYHRQILSSRYQTLFNKTFEPRGDVSTGPDFKLLEDSAYKYTDLLEVIRLAIHAESKAITFYSEQRESVSDPEDKSILKTLVRFEKGHKRKLEHELNRLSRAYMKDEQKAKGI